MTSSETSPADAIVAMRSWPRRYRTELLPIDDPAIETRAMTIGAAGVSATDLAADTVRSLTVLERALHEVVVTDDPVLHPAIIERSARRWDSAVAEAPAAVLAQLDDVAESFAAAIERTDASEWTRTGTCSGRRVSALDLVGEAVDTAATNLREMIAVLSSID